MKRIKAIKHFVKSIIWINIHFVKFKGIKFYLGFIFACIKDLSRVLVFGEEEIKKNGAWW